MKSQVSGSGEPLVLLPGGLTGWRSWIPHVEFLAASREVIRLQLLNVELGLSGAPLPIGYSVAYEVAALSRALNDLSISQADFASWSYGTVIALNFALHQPHRVRSLTLIEPSSYRVLPRLSPLYHQMQDEQRFLHSLVGDDISEEQLIALMHFFRLLPENTDPRSLPEWSVWYQHRQSLRIGDIEYRHRESIANARKFDKPVLVVAGEGSNPLTHAVAARLVELLPDARLITLPGGHAPHIESMQTFLELFTSFLSQVRSAV